MTRKEIGKIATASFGYGGYQDAMIGLTLTFSGLGWGVGHFVGSWGAYPERASYSREEWLQSLADGPIQLKNLLDKANRHTVDDLVGVPVEVTFEGGMLQSFRVLEEVL